ncbi:MAG: flagellar filament outer layer protein FlaA [Leptospirales bacterium]|nr:flagellar filament outer layer protein FlaA [Leptospirales bacterium]
MKIKKNIVFIVFLCAAGCLLINLSLRDADSKIVTHTLSDVSEDELRAMVVEDFENFKIAANLEDDGWFISSTPQAYTKGDEETKKRKNPVLRLELKPAEGGASDMRVEEESSPTGLGKEKKNVLGVNFQFRYPGNNSVSIEPPFEVDWKERTPVLTYDQSMRKEVAERALQLPGRIRAVSLWVHGRGFPYTLEVWIKDYKGDVHILKKQSVNFVGWRPLTFEVPVFIPQTADTYPVTRVVKLVRIVLRETTYIAGERSKTAASNTRNAFIFLDQIKVLSDTYEVYFDGQELHKAFDEGK